MTSSACASARSSMRSSASDDLPFAAVARPDPAPASLVRSEGVTYSGGTQMTLISLPCGCPLDSGCDGHHDTAYGLDDRAPEPPKSKPHEPQLWDLPIFGWAWREDG